MMNSLRMQRFQSIQIETPVWAGISVVKLYEMRITTLLDVCLPELPRFKDS